MDKRVVFGVCAAGMSLVLLGKTALLNTFLAFCILGVIPGTTIVMPSWLIVTLYPLIFLTLLYWLMTQSLFIGVSHPNAKPLKTTRTPKTSRSKTKQAVPKRRPRTAI